MRKIITISLFCLAMSPAFGQSQRKISGYLSAQFNKTIYDRAIYNNPWSFGMGFQLYFNNRAKLKPTIDLTTDAYLEDDKVARLNTDGTIIESVETMRNFFVGVTYQPALPVNFSFVAGPSNVGGRTLFGLKPSFGFYLSENRRWMGKISYINVFNRIKETKEDFGSISLSIAIKLF